MAVAPGRYNIVFNTTNVGRMVAGEPDDMNPKPVMVGPGTAPLWVVGEIPGNLPGNLRVLATKNTLVANIGGLLVGLLQDPPNAPDWNIIPTTIPGLFRIVRTGTNLAWTVPGGAVPVQIELQPDVGGANQAFSFV
ncbi:hypothetical protein P691DRAFT_789451 [Macrolepiota fuliginosa MF-IS2]|uniref:Uncharacterized protein n=1 Tax=Macrolepiota fuliginosa MF-IS2 TaxID=1400762 RepID=A0A9P5X1V0_9AGAR|nr:hypothetical protein P691DRAFT_789451 [Macrolepiota fuliginosa MF-IS2]